jgi:hypothetical protein
MYLHLGGDVLIKKDKVVAIIDLETAREGKVNNKLISLIKSNKNVNYVSEPGKEKTLIITIEGYYFSPISSMTLLKRSELGEE